MADFVVRDGLTSIIKRCDLDVAIIKKTKNTRYSTSDDYEPVITTGSIPGVAML
jgi:hypothetical protein